MFFMKGNENILEKEAYRCILMCFSIRSITFCQRTFIIHQFISVTRIPETLCISSHVIKQMKSDFPELKCLFRKSDNVGCYSANSVAELTHKIYKENNIQLLRYDYNESQ